MVQISVDNLKFDYPGVSVLHDITFDTAKPELIGILGPNGVGKSTLIHCMNRILTPTGGAVLVDEKSVLEYRLKELAQIMGYVPCSTSEAFPMTVVDTIMVGRHPRSSWHTSDEDFEVVYESIRQMGLEDLAMREFTALSAGQRQKVMLARGLAQEPNVLLLDEPTANLDIKHQYAVTKLMKRIAHEKNMQVVMICHDLNIASKYCERIILMSEGTIFAVGTPQEVITEENVSKVYGIHCKVIDDCGSPHVIVCDEDQIDNS